MFLLLFYPFFKGLSVLILLSFFCCTGGICVGMVVFGWFNINLAGLTFYSERIMACSCK